MTSSKRKLTPKIPPLRDLKAGEDFRATLLERTDGVSIGGYPLWHGWAIMDAFLAGVAYARSARKQAALRNLK